MFTALAGGVGAARFLKGLIQTIPEKDLTVIVNTGDDVDLFGLHISPDIDIVMYTLANIIDEKRMWGIRGDTFNFLKMMNKYGYDTWFNIGDKDLATHIQRTLLLRNGVQLSEVTSKLARSLDVHVKIIPMTNDPVQTIIIIKNGQINFQEYLVQRKAQDQVKQIRFKGIEESKPAPGIIDSILTSKAIIICPSNPIVSIGTILAVPGIKQALRTTDAKIIAISPIVGGAPIKGPADKLMQALGLEVSAFSVASLYKNFLDVFVIDEIDQKEQQRIESIGLKVVVTNTVMKSLEDKVQLAQLIIKLVK